MLKKSVGMQISYLIRSKSTIFISLALLAAISINFLINLDRNSEALYITEMYSFEKMLTLSDWTAVGYFMMEYYPLLIVIPTACAYIIDRNSGVNTYIQSRVGKRCYWYGKLVSVFVLTLLIFTLLFRFGNIYDTILAFYVENKIIEDKNILDKVYLEQTEIFVFWSKQLRKFSQIVREDLKDVVLNDNIENKNEFIKEYLLLQ